MKTKRFLTMLLAVLMVLALFPGAALANAETIEPEAYSIPADWAPPAAPSLTREANSWWPTLDIDVNLLPPGIDVSLERGMLFHLAELAVLSLLPGRQGMTINVTGDITMPNLAPPALIPTGTTVVLRGVGGQRTITNYAFAEHFIVAPGGTLVLENIILCGGETSVEGARHGGVRVEGAVFALGSLTHGRLYMSEGSVIRNSHATGNALTASRGGGVYLDDGGLLGWGGIFDQRQGGHLTMLPGSLITGNTASRGGGVYASYNAVVRMAGGAISGNQAVPRGNVVNAYNTGTGGGVHISENAILDMRGGVIEGNSAVYGGGVRLRGTDITNRAEFYMSGGEIRNNVAVSSPSFFTIPARGGGVRLCANSDFNMTGGRIHNNASAHGGGGVSVGYQSLTTPAIISIINRGGRLNMSGGSIDNNFATHSGGGVRLSAGALISLPIDHPAIYMTGGEIHNNTSNEGGGIWAESNTRVQMGRQVGDWWNNTGELPTIRDNTATRRGGGAFIGAFSNARVAEGIFRGNHAAQDGGAIFAQRYTYLSMLLPTCYPDLYILGPTRFEGNTAGRGAFRPPINASWWGPLNLLPGFNIVRFPNSAAVSPPGISHALNNFDVNYRGRHTIDGSPAPEVATAYFLWNDGRENDTFDQDSFIVGEQLDRPEDPVRVGYTFRGWHLNAAGTSPLNFDMGIPGNLLSERTIVVEGETVTQRYINIYASWERTYQNMIFVGNGGLPALQTVTIPVSNTYAQAITAWQTQTGLTEPTRAGYNFLHWSLAEAEGSPAVDGALSVTPERGMNLFAQWEEAIQPITVTFAPGTNGTLSGGTPNVTLEVAPGTVLTAANVPAVTANTGFRFVGWALSNPVGHTVNEPITFTAQYEPDVEMITVTFAPGANGTLAGGTPNVTIQVPAGTAIPAASVPAVTANTGFRHIGWTPNSPAGHTVTAPITFTAQYETHDLEPDPITVTFAPGVNGALVGGTPNVTIQVDAGTAIPAASVPDVTANEGFRFIGWTPNVPAGHVVTAPITFTAQYEPIIDIQEPIPVTFAPGENGALVGGTPYVVIHMDAGTAIPATSVPAVAANEGFRHIGWAPNDPAGHVVAAPITFIALYEPDDCACAECTCAEDCRCEEEVCACPPALERHLPYMFGDDHGNFRPNGDITRAEVAVILARTQLLDFEQNVRRLPPGMTGFTAFSDVSPNNWFFFYVAWAHDAGLIEGYAGRFRPNDPVTRQELAAMIARIGPVYPANATSFPDAGDANLWAARYLYTVYRRGLMQGDQNGFFHPQRNITRAEVATVVNRILGRIDGRDAYNAVEIVDRHNVRSFPDMTRENAWYFPPVLAATNDHYLTRDADGAIDWKQILPQ